MEARLEPVRMQSMCDLTGLGFGFSIAGTWRIVAAVHEARGGGMAVSTSIKIINQIHRCLPPSPDYCFTGYPCEVVSRSCSGEGQFVRGAPHHALTPIRHFRYQKALFGTTKLFLVP
ncbi:hypothetical protein [Azospirillum argentinense]